MSGTFESSKMDRFRETIVRHTSIVGLKWNKLEETEPTDTRDSPVTRSMSRRNALTENPSHVNAKPGRMLRRARSVRDAFGTIRQALRVSTRRKKRLINTESPLATILQTPASQRKRRTQDVKMYSPFSIDTPGTRRTTPRAIRMGVHQPKRFNFSSPGQVQRDVNALAEGIQALHSNTRELEKAMQGTPKLSTKESRRPQSSTPKRQSPRLAPIFV